MAKLTMEDLLALLNSGPHAPKKAISTHTVVECRVAMQKIVVAPTVSGTVTKQLKKLGFKESTIDRTRRVLGITSEWDALRKKYVWYPFGYTKPVATAKVATPRVEEDSDDDMKTVRRTLVRMHDRLSHLDGNYESIAVQLKSVIAAQIELQKAIDRLVRELVTTNPAPNELQFGARNGFHDLAPPVSK